MTATSSIALLRGINVGRAKRVAMADLRQLMEGLGYSNVRTLLNSGNVVFDAPARKRAAAAKAIEEALVLKLGVVSKVMVMSCAELDAVIDGNPLVAQATDPARLITFIFPAGECERVAALAERAWSPDALAIGARAAYVWCPDGVLDSAAAAALGKALGDAATARNWNTLLKLQALCRG